MKFSASSVPRVMKCPASAVLPRVESTSGAAQRGLDIHAYLANANTMGKAGALALVPESYRAECELLDLEHFPVDTQGFAAEVAYAYDVISGTAREVGRNIGRQYPALGLTEIAGTADVVGMGEGVVFVADFKTGSAEAAKESWQLRTLALMAALTYGAHRAVVEMIHVRPGDKPYRDRHELDELDLDATAHRLRELAGAVADAEKALAEGRLSYAIGDHCTYCPSARFCEARTALALRVTTAPDTVRPAELTQETAPPAWEWLKRAEAFCKELRADLETFATASPFALPSGKTVMPVESVRESVSGKVALRVLTDLHGEAVAAEAVTLETSKKAIQEALRQHKKNGRPMTEIVGETLDAIARAGGITAKGSVTVREVAKRG